MLSRVADSIYWMSRYIERAANTVRFLEVSHHLTLDAVGDPALHWLPLAQITGDMELFHEMYGEVTRENVVHFLVCNPDYPNSVMRCLNAARSNARGLREVLPPDLFQELNAITHNVPLIERDDVMGYLQAFGLCRQIKRSDILLTGLIRETMERGVGFYCWRLGKAIERADKTSRLLDVKYYTLLPRVKDVGTTLDDVQWTALLMSLDAREIYHRTHGLVDPHNVIRLIALDNAFPRSILFNIQMADESLDRITHDRIAEPHRRTKYLLERLRGLNSEDIINQGIHEFVDDLQSDLNDISNAIFDFFQLSPPTPES